MKNLIKYVLFTTTIMLCLTGCSKEDEKIQENIEKVMIIMSENDEELEESSEFEEETDVVEESDVANDNDIIESSEDELSSEVQTEEKTFVHRSEMVSIIEDYVLCSNDSIADFNDSYTSSEVSVLSSDICDSVTVGYCAMEMDCSPDSYSYIASITASYPDNTIIYVLKFNMSYDKIVNIETLYKN